MSSLDYLKQKFKSFIFYSPKIFGIIFLLIGIVSLIQLAESFRVNASYEKMIPVEHPYIKNYLENKDQLGMTSNSLRVVLQNNAGSIYETKYQEALKNLTDDLVLMENVDRSWVKSLWTPTVRWLEVTDEGFIGGPIIPDGYDGSARKIEELKVHVSKSSAAQSLISDDLTSSMIVVPLLQSKAINYSEVLEDLKRLEKKYESSDEYGASNLEFRVIGFAKLMGDLIEGVEQVAIYFLGALILTSILLFAYTRCVRSTFLIIACSLVGVVIQLALVTSMGFVINPYSILVPFLVFAIGVSHASQLANGILQAVGRGETVEDASKNVFNKLFVPGFAALISDAFGFAVLMAIDIPVIQELAVMATLGVAILILTNLIAVPVLISFVGVSASAATRSNFIENRQNKSEYIWKYLYAIPQRKVAPIIVGIGFCLAITGYFVSLDLKVGDLEQGAPELRANSAYNKDSDFINRKFSSSTDEFVLMVKTPVDGCLAFDLLTDIDLLALRLKELPGVQGVSSMSNAVRSATMGAYEGNPKWKVIPGNQRSINFSGSQSMVNNQNLANGACSLLPVIVYLKDHKADTLASVSSVIESFSEQYANENADYLLAAGNSGIEAATNAVVKEERGKTLLFVYAVVVILCFITFKSIAATVVAVLPLVMTSILAEALMVILGLGVKVATLPVMALGVGIGVDYALYLLAAQLSFQRAGHSLQESYRRAVQGTGHVVALVGCTLAASVAIWFWSPIKFQADMGLLFTFMFLWNMLGALVLIPALSFFFLRNVGRGEREDDVSGLQKYRLLRRSIRCKGKESQDKKFEVLD